MANFRIGELIPTVPPIIDFSWMKFGEDYKGQSGADYETTNAKKYTLNIEFPRLTKTEADLLESYAMALPSSLNSTLTLQDCERIFDGITVDPILNRILNLVRIKSWSGAKQLPYDEAGINNIYTATITVEEV